jgi:DNA-binding SARP family transcriptional activator
MRCHVALGERAEALRLYRRFADQLRGELGAAPGAELAALAAQLEAGSA